MADEVKAPAVDTNPNTSLRTALESAMEVHKDAIGAPETPALSTPSAPGEKPAKTLPDAATGLEKPERPEGSEVPTDQEIQNAEGTKQEPADKNEQSAEESGVGLRAPKSWKPDARSKWETTDPVIRREVVRRERETQRALDESSGSRQFAKSFQETIQPFGQKYAQSGLQPLQVIQNLMQADHLLSFAPGPDKAKFMAKLITDYGIDIGLLDAALSGGDPDSEPISVVEKMIEKRLAPLAEFVTTNKQTEAQRIAAETEAQRLHIVRMSEDEDKFPHFQTVADDMADIIEINSRRGVYLTPEQAYTRAVAMNPEASAANQEAAKRASASKANDAATRSLGASLSVSGAPAGLKGQVPPDDLRGTIEAAWSQAMGR